MPLPAVTVALAGHSWISPELPARPPGSMVRAVVSHSTNPPQQGEGQLDLFTPPPRRLGLLPAHLPAICLALPAPPPLGPL